MQKGVKDISIWGIIKIVSVVVGLFLCFYALDSYIDQKIENKITDPRFIRQIASNVRPSVIFDSKGTILIDMGGMQYIEKISVETDNSLRKPKKIIVTPKAYMGHAPLITSIGIYKYIFRAERGKNLDWEYTLDPAVQWGTMGEVPLPQFRLEVIP